MMETELKSVTRRYFEELWNKRNLAVLDEIVAPDVVGHVSGETIHGVEILRERIRDMSAIYSDARFTVEDQIAQGDKVLVRWTFHGRHTGEYRGVRPTGKEIMSSGMNLFCIADGQIQEMWVESDDLSELRQLGVVKLPR